MLNFLVRREIKCGHGHGLNNKNMNTLDYIMSKFKNDIRGTRPYEIFNYGRNKMTVLFKELGFEVGAEIGVCDATFSEILCKNIPGLKLYGVDPWEPYPEYTDYKLRATFNKMIVDTKKRMEPYNFIMIKSYSMKAVSAFEDNSLDFVYIDANHEYPFVLEDITEWSKKVRVGGIVAGHDYDRIPRSQLRKNWGVSDAVGKYITENNITPLFVLGTQEKVVGNERDPARTWMFIKQ
jgi:hypothetical protein